MAFPRGGGGASQGWGGPSRPDASVCSPRSSVSGSATDARRASAEGPRLGLAPQLRPLRAPPHPLLPPALPRQALAPPPWALVLPTYPPSPPNLGISMQPPPPCIPAKPKALWVIRPAPGASRLLGLGGGIYLPSFQWQKIVGKAGGGNLPLFNGDAGKSRRLWVREEVGIAPYWDKGLWVMLEGGN